MTPQQSYVASIAGLVVPAAATDVFTIVGSATRLVKVTRICLAATISALAAAEVQFIKRSTANSGGTATNPVGVPYDSADPAATAVVSAYTANPASLGTALGKVLTRKLTFGATGDLVVSPQEFTFGVGGGKPITLRSATEVLAVNLAGATLGSPLFDISVEWTEE